MHAEIQIIAIQFCVYMCNIYLKCICIPAVQLLEVVFATYMYSISFKVACHYIALQLLLVKNVHSDCCCVAP